MTRKWLMFSRKCSMEIKCKRVLAGERGVEKRAGAFKWRSG